MRKVREVWIVVADAATARFYATNEDVSALQPVGPSIAMSTAAKLPSRELKSDRPGRAMGSTRTGLRHAIEPKHDYHKMEKHHFTQTISKHLERALNQQAFDDLIIVAPKRSLGELRNLLSDQVKARVQAEVAKDLTHHAVEKVWKQVAETVQLLCTPRRRAIATAGVSRPRPQR